jgi:hypothetical protein
MHIEPSANHSYKIGERLEFTATFENDVPAMFSIVPTLTLVGTPDTSGRPSSFILNNSNRIDARTIKTFVVGVPVVQPGKYHVSSVRMSINGVDKEVSDPDGDGVVTIIDSKPPDFPKLLDIDPSK